MTALGVLVVVAFVLVCVQQFILVFGAAANDVEGGLGIAGAISVPIALVVIAAFIVALVT